MQLTTADWTRFFHDGIAYQVFLDGKDVTKQCAFADDEAGVVRLFERDPIDGGIRANKKGQPHAFQRSGAVEIRKLTRAEWEKYFGE